MSLAKLFALHDGNISNISQQLNHYEKELIKTAMWASEPIPFDPMEIAIHECYLIQSEKDEREEYHMIYEYPLSGKPPMMTHLFENKNGH